MDASSDAGKLIDKVMNPIAEPARLAGCPPLIRELGRASQGKRHGFVDATGARRTRMPMGVIVASYFLRAGGVMPTTLLDVLYRRGRSTAASGND